MNSETVSGAAVKNVDVAARIEIARKVGVILSGEHPASDREAALQLATVLVEDAAVSVREKLAKELALCTFLPENIINQITCDLDSVAVPFLVSSKALDDEFLNELVLESNKAIQTAIASRESISEMLAYSVCDVGALEAVDTLVGNDGAKLSIRSCEKVIDRFPDEVGLMEKLAQRADLPINVVERIVFKVSESFSEYLVDRFKLAPDYAEYLITLAKRQVFARSASVISSKEAMNYLRQLHKKNGLNSELLLSALQHKNLKFFIAGLAVLLNAEYEMTEKHLVTGESEALAKMLNTIGFAKSICGVLMIAYDRLINE
ncbi:DUF2336 domain-containing protein [Kordiimonas sp. SCSIO 12610]|uniref:DUF2336 domain-containing protein n=1 Tax=Kordiimonas sp. SCSIO 12610 TaxID=2829597 RepID=UPI00210D0954|nr:DUF2336 domain-containing protein [Kordiimonas sp. SCSIO 12610]UTW56741.1 DUF2336 domain-containing protein [Kordiimonas sp. SCSIO 12610]